MPLFVLCPLAVAACIWAYNHERSLEVLLNDKIFNQNFWFSKELDSFESRSIISTPFLRWKRLFLQIFYYLSSLRWNWMRLFIGNGNPSLFRFGLLCVFQVKISKNIWLKNFHIQIYVYVCIYNLGIFALYYVVWALLFIRQPQYTAERKANLTHATIWLLVVIPMIAFEVEHF